MFYDLKLTQNSYNINIMLVKQQTVSVANRYSWQHPHAAMFINNIILYS